MSQAQLIPFGQFNPSISLINGRPATTSLDIAKHFNKRHDSVLRDIRRLSSEVPEDFRLHNFVESSYMNEQDKGQPMFIVYFDGFILLVMGYTGKQSLQIKLVYIAKFNEMKEQLERLAMEERARVMANVNGLPGISITPEEQAQLKAIVDAKVGMLPSDAQRKAYGEIWFRFSRYFQIARYQQLPSEKMGEAVAYLVEMQISERKSLPQNEQVAAVTKKIDETPFIELAQEIQTAHEAVERILSPLQHKISSLSYFVSKELGKQTDVQITCIQDMDIRNCLWGYLSSSLLSGIREAMVYPSRHLEPYANPGYSLLGIVKQLNSARE